MKQVFLSARVRLLAFLLCVFGIWLAQAAFTLAAPSPVLYVNGNKSAVQPIIVNQSTMLPLRDTFHLFDCDTVQWEETTSTVRAIIGDLTLILQIGNKTALENYSNAPENGSEELPQAPVLKNGKVYLPLRYVAETFNAYINYNKGRVDIATPFLYKNQQWYVNKGATTLYDYGYQYDSNVWQAVTVDNQKVKKQGDTLYYWISAYNSNFIGWMNANYLYALDSNGKAKLLFHFYGEPEEYKISGDTLYYQMRFAPLSGATHLMKATLATEPIQESSLGQSNFLYGSKITLDSDSGHPYCNGYSPGNWEVKPEGIYAVGYTSDALLENVVEDLALLKETYGYYLIDPKTNKHTLVQKLDLEYK